MAQKMVKASPFLFFFYHSTQNPRQQLAFPKSTQKHKKYFFVVPWKIITLVSHCQMGRNLIGDLCIILSLFY